MFFLTLESVPKSKRKPLLGRSIFLNCTMLSNGPFHVVSMLGFLVLLQAQFYNIDYWRGVWAIEKERGDWEREKRRDLGKSRKNWFVQYRSNRYKTFVGLFVK